jgi:hypothetical protein
MPEQRRNDEPARSVSRHDSKPGGKDVRLKFQIAVLGLAGIWWLALPASAQVEVGDVTATMAGDLGFGYSGSFTDPGQSSHGTDVTGTGYLKGYYHDPGFVAFRVQPSYGRNQDNSDSQSIFDTGNVTANAAIFSGSNFPGNVTFTKALNSAGQFGISGANGLITKSDSQAFAINWNEQVPDWPTLSLGFSDSSGESSLLGSSEESHSSMRAYSLRTGYRLLGFTLGGDVTHENANFDSSLLAGTQDASDTSSTSYGVSVAHRLPLNGYFSTRYGRSDYNDTAVSTDSKYYGTADNISSTLGFVVKVPVTITANYTDDVFGSVQQYLISQGNYVPLTNSTPKSSQLALNASSQFVLWHSVNFSGYVNHIEQNIGDFNYSTTQGGGTVGYAFTRILKGLFVNAGVVNTANQNGNQGAALIGDVNYGRDLGRWGFNANFAYDQSTNTAGIVYTTSSMNYSASIGRRFSDSLRWSASFSGGHSGLAQQAGYGSHSESYFSILTWRRLTASGYYSQSGGTSILTQSGLLTQPLPTQPFGGLTTFSARSVSGGVGMSPLPRLTINGSYSRANIYTQNSALTSTNLSDQINARVTYRFRKMNFNAGYNQVRQLVSASGTPPITINVYYFGITRWFDFF